MNPSTRRGGVQIEVLDEEEYDMEVQRANEARLEQREQERRMREKAQREIGTTNLNQTTPISTSTHKHETPSATAISPTSSTPSASATVTTATPTVWQSLLSQLTLPAFFASLSDTKTYNPTEYQQLMSKDVPLFHRSASRSLAALSALLVAGTPRPDRSTVCEIVLTVMRFLVPNPPPTPTMEHTSQNEEEEHQDSLSGKSMAIEYAWQAPELSIAAAQVIDALGQMESTETNDQPAVNTSAPLSSQPIDTVTQLLTSPHVQSLFSHHLPALLALLRPLMRIGSSETCGGEADWKSAARFPTPYVVIALLTHAPRSAIEGEIGSILPLLLPMVDDHEQRFKLVALACLNRLLQQVAGSRWPQGSGALIGRSLQTCLSFRERSIVALTVPAYVQSHMTFAPAIILRANEDEQDSELRRKIALFLTDPSKADAALRERVRTQAALVTTILNECTFYTLSPSAENSFALFVYAQVMLPLVLYVGPIGILPVLQQLLSLLSSWAAFTEVQHTRTVVYAWQTIEALLHLHTLDRRIAETTVGALIELSAQVWMVGVEKTRSVRSLTSTSNRIGLDHPASSTIISVLRRLRTLEPKQFQTIWSDIADIPELQTLEQALSQ